MDDIIDNIVMYGVLDPSNEVKVVQSPDETLQFYKSLWMKFVQEKKRKTSMPAFMLYHRMHMVCSPIWSDETLRNILRQLLSESLMKQYSKDIDEEYSVGAIDQVERSYLVESLIKISKTMNKKNPIFLLMRNILTENTMFLLSSSEKQFPYGSDMKECVLVTDNLLSEISLHL